MRHRIILVGTGTEVGKTHVGEVLACGLVAAGEKVAALKPVETGVQGVVGASLSDAERLGAASMFHVKQSRYQYARPVSPHLAARLEGERIELDVIADWVAHHDATWQLVETAGGLLSPLNSEQSNLDLAVQLRPTALVLVGFDRLGVLHDIRACLAAIRAKAAEIGPRLHIVLNTPSQPDASTGTNAAELHELGIADRAWVLPRCGPSAPAVGALARQLLDELGRPGS